MKLIYLVQGEKTRESFAGRALPEGIVRDIKPYGKLGEDGISVITFECETDGIGAAKKLAAFRDELPKKSHTHLIEDEPSLKLCEKLYPLLAHYERELRKAITLAMCTEEKNFSDRIVNGLSDSTLSGLGVQLFYDSKFDYDTRTLITEKKTKISKAELLKEIKQIEEKTVWDDIFSNEPLESVKGHYDRLCTIRNDVTHHQTISPSEYEEARRLLSSSIAELEKYTLHQLQDDEYAEEQTGKALTAAKRLGSNYAAMLSEASNLTLPTSAYSESFAKLAEAAQVSALAEAVRQSFARSEALAAASKAITDSISLPENIINAFHTPAMEQLARDLQSHQSGIAESVARLNASMPNIASPYYSQSILESFDDLENLEEDRDGDTGESGEEEDGMRNNDAL